MPKPPNPSKARIKCPICKYLRTHPEDIDCKIDEDLIEGKLTKKQLEAKYHAYGWNVQQIQVHWKPPKNGRTGNRPESHVRRTLRLIDEENKKDHARTISDKLDEIYDQCWSLSKKAEGKAQYSKDFEAAARCLDNACKTLAIIKGVDEPKVTQTTNINFSKLTNEELELYAKLAAKIEGSETGTGETKPA